MNVLAVDVGRTTVRASLLSDGVPGPRVHRDADATLSDPSGVARLLAVLDGIWAELGSSPAGMPDSFVVAAAGAMSRPAAAGRLLEALVSRGYCDGSVVVTTDIVAAHAGGLAGRAGVLLAAGTGAAALAVDASGDATLVDGAGYLVGDAGSGFAVGRAGLSAAIRHGDGRPGGSAALAALAVERFGPLDQLPGQLHADQAPARVVASFAPAVARAARDGDAEAMAIWDRAVSDLADTAVAACAKLPRQDRRVAVTGGLFDINDLVTAPFTAVMAARAPGVPTAPAAGDAIAGAGWVAGCPAGIYEKLLLRGDVHQAGNDRRADG